MAEVVDSEETRREFLWQKNCVSSDGALPHEPEWVGILGGRSAGRDCACVCARAHTRVLACTTPGVRTVCPDVWGGLGQLSRRAVVAEKESGCALGCRGHCLALAQRSGQACHRWADW